jgi:hypothetical protein
MKFLPRGNKTFRLFTAKNDKNEFFILKAKTFEPQRTQRAQRKQRQVEAKTQKAGLFEIVNGRFLLSLES